MIYLIERLDEVGYDEYDSFVVRAKDPKQALDICSKRAKYFNETNTQITKLCELGEDEIILGSFNAG